MKQTAMTTLEFVCRDTGIGMAEAFQKRIFEPFAQEHAGSRTKFAGTGLGMPITKKLVEKMGGTISFESKEGTGTTFVIRIPFQIDADMKDRTETEEKTKASIQGLHVLLAEDNELNMEIAEFVLQNEGTVVTNEKEKMEQVSFCAFGDGDSRITSVWLRREKCGKRRCRNHHSVFMEHKAV